LAEKYSELHELETMQVHCKDVIYDASNFEDYDWKDPVWLGHRRLGHSEGMANKWLNMRIKAALHNISQQQKRGVDLLCHREAEYTSGKMQEPEERSDVSWSDAEEKYDIEDDLPLDEAKRLMKPSKRWIEKHCVMESENSEWNRERLRAQQNRSAAGTYNEMDGRYHSRRTSEEALMQQHQQRTESRRICSYFARGFCKNGYSCTLKHVLKRRRHDSDHEEAYEEGLQVARRTRTKRNQNSQASASSSVWKK
jgi:hypothetical protein